MAEPCVIAHPLTNPYSTRRFTSTTDNSTLTSGTGDVPDLRSLIRLGQPGESPTVVEDTLSIADRVAALLMLLYGQNAARISKLTLAHVHLDDHVTDRSSTGVWIRLGQRRIEICDPPSGLVRELVTARTPSARPGGAQTWLFPGRIPDRPITDAALRQRLTRIGVQAGPARTTALFQLATEIPAAILARTLGIDIQTAVRWQQASAGDWATYAADVSHRHQQ